MSVVAFHPRRYEARLFRASTLPGEFQVAGTLCGQVDLACPGLGEGTRGLTYSLLLEEILVVIAALKRREKTFGKR